MPHDQNYGLVNRDEIFKNLDRLLTPSLNRSLAIWGLGGCGYVESMLSINKLAYNLLVRRRSLSNMPIAVKKKPHVQFSGSTQILRLVSRRTLVLLPRRPHYPQI